MKTYEISDDDLDSILMRLAYDPDGKPTSTALRIAEDLVSQQEAQGGRDGKTQS